MLRHNKPEVTLGIARLDRPEISLPVVSRLSDFTTTVSDVNRFAANHGLPPLTNANFISFLPAGVNSVPAADPCGSSFCFEEETLDVTAVHSLCR
jgi:hypothetical protein